MPSKHTGKSMEHHIPQMRISFSLRGWNGAETTDFHNFSHRFSHHCEFSRTHPRLAFAFQKPRKKNIKNILKHNPFWRPFKYRLKINKSPEVLLLFQAQLSSHWRSNENPMLGWASEVPHAREKRSVAHFRYGYGSKEGFVKSKNEEKLQWSIRFYGCFSF